MNEISFSIAKYMYCPGADSFCGSVGKFLHIFQRVIKKNFIAKLETIFNFLTFSFFQG